MSENSEQPFNTNLFAVEEPTTAHDQGYKSVKEYDLKGTSEANTNLELIVAGTELKTLNLGSDIII